MGRRSNAKGRTPIAVTLMDKRAHLIVEPVQPRALPSKRYLRLLQDLGADQETIEVAAGRRSFSRRLLAP